MPLKKILILDGVVAVCRFRDDGVIMDAAGLMPQDLIERLAHFAQWYRRMVSGNIDLLSLFSQMSGWSPSQGWIVRGAAMTVCGVGNMVCMIENEGSSLNEIMRVLNETAHE
jgi:roadblock/LC7 domain-containing protein